MQKTIMKDPLFLSQKSTAANPKADAQVVRDLQDTLRANRDRCVGMAANMIGVKKNIIIVAIGPIDLVMLNPRITKKQGPYETEEGCLSHTGTKKTTRYQMIEVAYMDPSGKKHTGTFTDFTAQVIQHEIDHLDGVLI
ncbi:MAG: peptide deformylase [Carnobacterium sp.]|nr:peptide deformylase [Carnobacterium sp.]